MKIGMIGIILMHDLNVDVLEKLRVRRNERAVGIATLRRFDSARK